MTPGPTTTAAAEESARRWSRPQVGSEGQCGIDQLLLPIGRIEDQHARGEGDRQREQDDRPRAAAGREDSDRAASSPPGPSARRSSRLSRALRRIAISARRSSRNAVPTQIRKGATKVTAQRDRRIAFGVQDRVDPRSANEDEHGCARGERDDVEIQPLPERRARALDLATATDQLDAKLAAQRGNRGGGRQDGRGQDANENPPTMAGPGFAAASSPPNRSTARVAPTTAPRAAPSSAVSAAAPTNTP